MNLHDLKVGSQTNTSTTFDLHAQWCLKNRYFEWLKAFGYIDRVVKSYFLQKKPILLHMCATCSELPSYIIDSFTLKDTPLYITLILSISISRSHASDLPDYCTDLQYGQYTAVHYPTLPEYKCTPSKKTATEYQTLPNPKSYNGSAREKSDCTIKYS